MNNDAQAYVPVDRDEISRSTAETKLITPIDVLFRTEGVMPSEKLHRSVVAKIRRISRRIPDAIRARVHIQRDCSSRSPRSFRAHVLYEIKGNDISAQHRGRNPSVALQGATEKLRRRLRRRKTALLAQRAA